MEAHGLDPVRFLRLFADEERISWVRRVREDEVESMMADHLRVSGQFSRGGTS